MPQFSMQAKRREAFGKNASRRLRVDGRIPAVVYGRGHDSVSVTVDPKEVIRILYSESGRNTIFKLQVEGSEQDVLVKDFQLHPIRGDLLHADFQMVAMDEKMVFEVPVQIEGIAEGVKVTGGVLDLVLREIQLECLPGDVPDHIIVDVTLLEVGDSIRVQDLGLGGEKIEVLSEPELVVATVVPPQAEEEEEEVVEEEGAEPEVIAKGKDEEEEGEVEQEQE